MRKPIVGVIGSAHSVHDILNVQHVGEQNLLCISEVAEALPLMFAGRPGITDIDALLDTVDGILLTGARANVHPSCFGVDPDVRYEPYDRNRDALVLPLVRACIDRGVPLLGICRGLQEMNVAFGGSLHPEVRDLPGRMNHRAPRAEDGSLHRDPKVVFADRHEVRLVVDGEFAKLFGCLTIRVNSLHGQAILEPGNGIVVEGWPRTAQSKRYASLALPHSLWASSGMPKLTRAPTLSIEPCSGHLEPRYVKATVLGAG